MKKQRNVEFVCSSLCECDKMLRIKHSQYQNKSILLDAGGHPQWRSAPASRVNDIAGQETT